MPRFSHADDAFLKRTMLPRAPDCHYTQEDIELCMQQTGHDKPTIKNWEKCLRFKFRMSHKSHAEIEEYLKASPESLDGKVMSLTCPLFTYATEITLALHPIMNLAKRHWSRDWCHTVVTEIFRNQESINCSILIFRIKTRKPSATMVICST